MNLQGFTGMHDHKDLAWTFCKCALATHSQGPLQSLSQATSPHPCHLPPKHTRYPHITPGHTHTHTPNTHTPRWTHTTRTPRRGAPSPTAVPPACRMRDRHPGVDMNTHKATQKRVKKKTFKKITTIIKQPRTARGWNIFNVEGRSFHLQEYPYQQRVRVGNFTRVCTLHEITRVR